MGGPQWEEVDVSVGVMRQLKASKQEGTYSRGFRCYVQYAYL